MTPPTFLLFDNVQFNNDGLFTKYAGHHSTRRIYDQQQELDVDGVILFAVIQVLKIKEMLSNLIGFPMQLDINFI